MAVTRNVSGSNLGDLSGRGTRISFTGRDSTAIYVEWQIFNTRENVDNQSSPYPYVISTNDNGVIENYDNVLDAGYNYITLWLPPEDVKVRYRQMGGEDASWSSWQTITYQKLNSFDKFRLLSGLPIIEPAIISTATGATVVTGDSDICDTTCINTNENICDETDEGATCDV